MGYMGYMNCSRPAFVFRGIDARFWHGLSYEEPTVSGSLLAS